MESYDIIAAEVSKLQEKYFYINASGNSIHCKLYYVDRRAVKRVVLCAHGFSGHMDNRAVARFADYVLKKHKDVAVVIYNAPGHGDDVKKKLMLADCDAYITQVTAYIRESFKPEQLFVYANSFGGYQILKYIAEHGDPFDKVALRCPAVNMYQVMTERIASPAEKKALARNKPIEVGFDRKIKITRSFLEELEAADITTWDFRPYAEDILIFHGTKDEIVPYAAAAAFAEKNGIRFVPVENADHRFVDPLKMDFVIKQITAFFGM